MTQPVFRLGCGPKDGGMWVRFAKEKIGYSRLRSVQTYCPPISGYQEFFLRG
jgi:hypothetical protein